MKEHEIYVNKVVAKFPNVAKTYREAVAFLDDNGQDVIKQGFVVGNKYFIEQGTFHIYDKSVFYLINYLDEFDDEFAAAL